MSKCRYCGAELLWDDEVYKKVIYVPSSSFRPDAAIIGGHLYETKYDQIRFPSSQLDHSDVAFYNEETGEWTHPVHIDNLNLFGCVWLSSKDQTKEES